MHEQAIDAGAILSRTFNLMRGNVKMVAITAIAVAVASMIGSALGLAAMIFAQYTIISGLLANADLMPDGYRTRRFWAILGVCILYNIGVTLGMVLLIVPGVILAVRWVLAVPVLIGEETGVIESLGRSWQETRGRFWPILIALIVIFLPVIAMMGIIGGVVFSNGGAEPALAITLIGNLVSSIFTVAGWHAAVAIYVMLRVRGPRMEEIFA
ncbi:Membrane domain of glycerophosphoryl diester phosphodiesterase [Sphingomonas laterariae]|uniref:Membrane domain of glycerophosphoryl diester phosphodiesterase n=1 Tax=Edaphosphingomonas laterariae TaxID=861865 RepID=A0A239BLG9_9SPHN|nr:glycerophosphoryl diester phosphodiesterase membrane domain-containing protein [Sphingomonas laterariae]SNS08985.1 Membrane domain of glycerophosphoryl diester phosphodiesterase [Sphingomonas laterariae]